MNVLTSYPKVMAITVINIPKNASSFRNPYLSSKRNVKVSAIVIRTPAHSGILCRYTYNNVKESKKNKFFNNNFNNC